MYSVVTIIILLTGQTNGQYGEIASLIGDSLTPGLFGSAASGLAGAASGLLGKIGTLYQIAQGALQLTGTGVGILNQAAEGKWFNKVVEEARNANREIQERTLIGNRLEPDYSQFGINFPAPAPSDYDHEETAKPESLIPINANNMTTERIVSTETPLITLFPEEKETNNLNEKENRNTMNVISVNENGEEINRSENRENTEADKKLELTEEKLAKLQRFITLLHESNITGNDLSELTQMLEEERMNRSKSVKSTATESRTVFTNATTLQQINNETSKTFITAPPITFRHIETGDVIDNEDNDLLPSSTSRSRARAAMIKYQPSRQPRINSTLATIYRPRKYPRRIAYQARLPFVTSATHTAANIEKPKQLEVKMNERAIQQLHLTKQKPAVLRQQFLQPTALNPYGQSEIFLTAPASGIFQTPTLPPPLYSQPMNVIKSYPPHMSGLEGRNTNNGLWTHQNPKYILGESNSYFNSNADPFILPFYNRNPS
ncbi:Uncharacterized protein BM_BM4257 [Brugia malayi]|uniref:Uncharacterized protein n=1 Tax=Brugia malayi TaxID=6279 RepID=A0A4E9F1J6_BRUMA|nr:Uncharacterized protein BM_BM4257 [Brugia malayi]VIO89622.1 Uncharacterized protein BM_BM4257 [Brugia malayi]